MLGEAWLDLPPLASCRDILSWQPWSISSEKIDKRGRYGRVRDELAMRVVRLRGCSRSAGYFDKAFSCVHLQGEILSCG